MRARVASLGLLFWFAWTAAAQVSVSQFGLLCANATDGYPFPFKTYDFCGSMQLDQPNSTPACMLWEFLLQLLASPASNPLVCVPDTRNDTLSKTRDWKGRYIPQPLPDRRTDRGQLPAELDTNTVMEVEGGTLNWLFKNILRLAGWAPCEALGIETSMWRPPAGFQRLAILNLTNDRLLEEYNITATSLPVMAIIKQASNRPRNTTCWDFVAAAASTGGIEADAEHLCSGGHLVVIIRGTASAHESRLDFTYNTVKAPEYGAGEIHAGFKTMADELWDGGLRKVLLKEFVNGAGAMRHITIAGHSLGAAVATLLSARAQKFLQEQCAGKQAWEHWLEKQPLVTGVLFAAPHVGNSAFTEDFGRRVNARRLAFKFDLTSQVPCTPKVTACNNPIVPTPNPAGYWNYSKVGGQLAFEPADLPRQQSVWSRLNLYTKSNFCSTNGTSVARLKSATHICSYLCKTSKYTRDKLDWCRLWFSDKVPKGAGAYCMEGAGRDSFQYPANPPFPPN